MMQAATARHLFHKAARAALLIAIVTWCSLVRADGPRCPNGYVWGSSTAGCIQAEIEEPPPILKPTIQRHTCRTYLRPLPAAEYFDGHRRVLLAGGPLSALFDKYQDAARR